MTESARALHACQYTFTPFLVPYKRREMRNAKTPHGAKGGKRRQGEAEEGEMSDGASSVASKLARGVRGMHAHDEGDLR